MSDVKTIVASIKDAVDSLSSGAEIKQDALFKSLIGLTKSLETRGDVLLNNVKNLGLINQIKVKLERLIIDPKYKEDVKKFIGSYSGIQDLSNQYFSQFNAKFKPSATANGVKQTAIQSTLNGLFENGINTGVIDGLKKILQTNISAGGSYAHLTEQLRNYMLTNDTGEGALQRYVKTYANTAINQFSAEYNKSIADDLGLEWYGYDGSLLTTSREFCDKCVEKKYIHISEFPAIIAGNFGALGDIHITKSTGLPDGMMVGTDETNLVRRRGGWNCGHQMIAVAESVVPQNIRDTVYATQAYKNWAAKNGKVAKEAAPIVSAKVEQGNKDKKAKVMFNKAEDGPRLIKPLKEYDGSLQDFVDEVMSSKRTNNTVKTLGTMHKDVIADLSSKGIELSTNDIVISDKKILKYLNPPKRDKGAAIDIKRFDEVAKAINNPSAIFTDNNSKALVYVYANNYDHNYIKVIVEPKYKIGSEVVNLAKSIGIVDAINLNDKSMYTLISGKL